MTNSTSSSDRKRFNESILAEIYAECDGDEARAIDVMSTLVALFQTATAINHASLSSRKNLGFP